MYNNIYSKHKAKVPPEVEKKELAFNLLGNDNLQQGGFRNNFQDENYLNWPPL